MAYLEAISGEIEIDIVRCTEAESQEIMKNAGIETEMDEI